MFTNLSVTQKHYSIWLMAVLQPVPKVQQAHQIHVEIIHQQLQLLTEIQH